MSALHNSFIVDSRFDWTNIVFNLNGEKIDTFAN